VLIDDRLAQTPSRLSIMSGAEAIVVLGVISSLISIIEATKKTYDAATDSHGLPSAFREVASRLPIVKNILDSAQQHLTHGDVDETRCNGVKSVIEACTKKAKRLNELFDKAIPADGSSGVKRYLKAVKTLGKGNEIEKLMKGILEDVQLLASEHGMKIATNAQKEQITQAIVEVSALEPSVPDEEFQDTGFSPVNLGPGTQYNAQGEYIAQGQARQYNAPGGTMHFGKD
jgi:hypothetical protein